MENFDFGCLGDQWVYYHSSSDIAIADSAEAERQFQMIKELRDIDKCQVVVVRLVGADDESTMFVWAYYDATTEQVFYMLPVFTGISIGDFLKVGLKAVEIMKEDFFVFVDEELHSFIFEDNGKVFVKKQRYINRSDDANNVLFQLGFDLQYSVVPCRVCLEDTKQQIGCVWVSQEQFSGQNVWYPMDNEDYDRINYALRNEDIVITPIEYGEQIVLHGKVLSLRYDAINEICYFEMVDVTTDLDTAMLKGEFIPLPPEQMRRLADFKNIELYHFN